MATEAVPRPQGPPPGVGANAAGVILHENLTLIEVDDPAALAELRADRAVGPLVLTALSDRVAAVAPGRTDELIKRLLRAGHTPKVLGA